MAHFCCSEPSLTKEYIFYFYFIYLFFIYLFIYLFYSLKNIRKTAMAGTGKHLNVGCKGS